MVGERDGDWSGARCRTFNAIGMAGDLQWSAPGPPSPFIGRGLNMTRRLLCFLLLALPAAAGWREVRPGIEAQRLTRKGVDVHVVRIDLASRNLRLIASERKHRGLTVAEFAAKTGAIVAINGDYFTESMQTIGLAMGRCDPWSLPKRTRVEPVIAAGSEKVRITTMDTPPAWVRDAVSGWPLLVTRCAARKRLPGRDSFTKEPHRRTAVGLTKDGKNLLLITTAGQGLSLDRLAALLEELGACEAVNLDGGSSTAMWLDGALLPGSARGRVANHLAVIDAAGYSACERTKEMEQQ
jgi:hypothetical protein